jgi:phage terminase large subunit GpA-like protein
LTCGVDTQDDRIEAHVVAWTPFFEAFSIYYKIFPGDPSTLELWDKLDEFLRSSFPSDYGFPLPIRATCIDSGGHHTQMVYNFCRARTKSNIWAVKGSSWSREGDPIWPQPESRKHKRRSDVGFKPMILGTNALKDFAHGLIHNDTPGPNYLHIPRGRSDGWLSQLTSEFAVLERVAGQTVRRWHLPPGRANEAFDTLCYATAAVFGLKSVKAIDMHVWHEQLLEHAKQFGKAAS